MQLLAGAINDQSSAAVIWVTGTDTIPVTRAAICRAAHSGA